MGRIFFPIKSNTNFVFSSTDSDYAETLAKEWVLQHTHSKLSTGNRPHKYLVASWAMAAGFEAPAVIVVTKNLEDVCNRNYYLRAKANLVIYHIPEEEPEYMPGSEWFQNNPPSDKKSPEKSNMTIKKELKPEKNVTSNSTDKATRNKESPHWATGMFLK